MQMAPTSFDALKKSRSASLDKLNQQLDKISSKSYSDPNEGKYWKPTRDKAGNGFAIIRFLPAPQGEEMPFVRIWDHGFQGPTGLWYIENSLTTLSQDDPVSEYNSKLWNSGIDSDKDQARKQKRRLKYVANILVLKDAANPENEGKVFLYSFGKKIFDKLNDLMNPTFEDETPVNPFDFWEGADFKLKIRNLEGYRNYDKSEFSSAAALSEDDEKLEAVYNQMHDLTEFTNPENYKTYDELKVKLAKVLGEDVNAGVPTIKEEVQMNEPVEAPKMPVTAEEISNPDDDDTLAYFSKLANAE